MHFSIKFNWSKLDDEVPNSALCFAQRHSHWERCFTVRVPCLCLHLHTYSQWNDLTVLQLLELLNENRRERVTSMNMGWGVPEPISQLTEAQKGYFGACLRLHELAALGFGSCKAHKAVSCQSTLSPPNVVLVSAPALLDVCHGPQRNEGATQKWFFSGCT